VSSRTACIFDGCEVPHYNYVGDSILGHKAHLAAGVILSNVRLDRLEVTVKTDTDSIPTGLRKFGAIIGDYAEIGCNSVISPGSIIGRRSIVYPLTHFSGVLDADLDAEDAADAAGGEAEEVIARVEYNRLGGVRAVSPSP
jgi:hypothetical protein